VTAIFFDTSVLMRRYDRTEPGSRRIRAVCAPEAGNSVVLSQLAPVELASALSRKQRLRTLQLALHNGLWRLFQTHWRDEYQVVALHPSILGRAEQLVFQYPLRAFDAIHIACALAVAGQVPREPLEFWTADRQQAAAASAEGLTVELIA
jgi:predicted nucleic acid-binding protein